MAKKGRVKMKNHGPQPVHISPGLPAPLEHRAELSTPPNATDKSPPPAPENILVREDEDVGIAAWLEGQLDNVQRPRMRLEATMMEMKQLLCRMHVKDDHSTSAKSDNDSKLAKIPPEVQKPPKFKPKTPAAGKENVATGQGANIDPAQVPLYQQIVTFGALKTDVLRIEQLLSNIVLEIAERCRKQPDKTLMEFLSLVYGACVIMKGRLGFANRLEAGQWHEVLLKGFSVKLNQMVLADPKKWAEDMLLAVPKEGHACSDYCCHPPMSMRS